MPDAAVAQHIQPEWPVNAAASQRRIVLRSGRRSFFFVPQDIDWIGAAGNYSEVHCRGDVFLVREVVGSLARRLEPFGFARIDRSAVVNVSRVFEIRKTGKRAYAALLSDGTQLRLSPTYRSDLERRLIS